MEMSFKLNVDFEAEEINGVSCFYIHFQKVPSALISSGNFTHFLDPLMKNINTESAYDN